MVAQGSGGDGENRAAAAVAKSGSGGSSSCAHASPPAFDTACHIHTAAEYRWCHKSSGCVIKDYLIVQLQGRARRLRLRQREPQPLVPAQCTPLTPTHNVRNPVY
jgi:hypothetical protein